MKLEKTCPNCKCYNEEKDNKYARYCPFCGAALHRNYEEVVIISLDGDQYTYRIPKSLSKKINKKVIDPW